MGLVNYFCYFLCKKELGSCNYLYCLGNSAFNFNCGAGYRFTQSVGNSKMVCNDFKFRKYCSVNRKDYPDEKNMFAFGMGVLSYPRIR